jgi:glycosyltransferase involved in cell wall biosynthesis
MEPIKFSIVVPTRDRASVLYHCLKTIVSQSYKNLEIIVSDNHSQDNTEEVVKSFDDQRIVYIKPPHKLSMSHHFEFALDTATGDYIGSIGDDDGLLPNCFEYLNSLILKHGRYAISCQNSGFLWGNNYINPSTIEINMRTGSSLYDSKSVLKRLYTHRNHYSSCPIIYYGFIPRELYNYAKEVSNNKKFFNSMIPDIYSALLLTNITDKYIYSLKPYCIAGISKFSNGQSTIQGKSEEQKNEGVKFITEAPIIPFHKNVEFCLSSIKLLMVECYFQLRENVAIDFDLDLDIEQTLKIAYLESLSKDLETKTAEIEAIKKTCEYNHLDFDSLINGLRLPDVSLGQCFKQLFEPKTIHDDQIITIDDAVTYHENYYHSHSHVLYNIGRLLSQALKRSKYV